MPCTARRSTSYVLTVTTSGASIPVVVTRKRVKNLNLRVKADGSVSLSIPATTSLRAAQAFLDRRAAWIAAHLEQVRARKQLRLEDTGSHAGTVPLWGELIDASALNTTLDDLYRRELARRLPDVVERVEERMGVHALSWQLRRMTSRWGSCTPARRSIRMNTMLAAYPPTCLEFVVTHELCHLIEPSHNARFHELLDRFCPRNRDIAAMLKRSAREVARSSTTRDEGRHVTR